MATPLDSLHLAVPVDHLLHRAATACSRRRQAIAARFLLSLYDGRGVALYHLRVFPPAQRAWFLAALQVSLADPPGWTKRHWTRLSQLQHRSRP
jgi:hypothetical protein